MALFSPSKNDRIERHLMRQRGAGARNIAVDFGFAFAFSSSNASSSQPEPIAEEPPAKRRKISDPPKVEHSKHEIPSSTAVEKDGGEKKIAKKSGKGRRRLKEELEDDRPKTPQENAEDDSFIHSVKPKRTKSESRNAEPVEEGSTAGAKENAKAPEKPTKRPRKPKPKPKPETKTSDPGETHAAVEISKGRPRRQAAVDATAKVADGFVEEAMPIDKKRRDPVPETKPRSRCKNISNAAEEPPKSVEAEHQLPSESRKSTCEVREVIAVTASESDATLAARDKKAAKAPPKRKIAKPAKPNSEDLSQTPDIAEVRDTQNKTTDILDARVTSKSCKPPSRSKSNETENIACKGKSKSSKASKQKNGVRQPLQEADVNTTLRMASPNKSDTSKQDSAISGLTSKGPVVKLKASSSNKGAKSKVSSKPSIPASKGPQKSDECKDDEDIDWLFAPQQPTRSAPRTTKPSATASRTKTSKMVDIDLDDLVSNIASYAKEVQAVAAPKAISRKRKI